MPNLGELARPLYLVLHAPHYLGSADARFEDSFMTVWVFIPCLMGLPGAAAFASVGALAAYNVSAPLGMISGGEGFIVSMFSVCACF